MKIAEWFHNAVLLKLAPNMLLFAGLSWALHKCTSHACNKQEKKPLWSSRAREFSLARADLNYAHLARRQSKNWPIKSVIFNTGFPKCFACSVGWHVKTNDIISPFILKTKMKTKLSMFKITILSKIVVYLKSVDQERNLRWGLLVI